MAIYGMFTYMKTIKIIHPIHVGRNIKIIDDWYLLELPPAQDASHHKDYDTFLVVNPKLNLHLWLAFWMGSSSKRYLQMMGSPSFIFNTIWQTSKCRIKISSMIDIVDSWNPQQPP